MWNGSRHSVAFSQTSRATAPIHSAASADTRRMRAQRFGASTDRRTSGGFCARIRDDASRDRSDGAPRDAHQPDHRGLRRVSDQPGHLIIERSSVPGPVTSPRHSGRGHRMLATADPGRVSFDEHSDRAGIQRRPSTPSLTQVIARTPTLAAPCRAPPLGDR
jgi:hypothetical protein